MVYDLLDLSLLCKVPDGHSCQRATDLQSLDQDRLGNELEGGDLLHDTVIGGWERESMSASNKRYAGCARTLVKSNRMLRLILDLALRPLLLLGGFATAGGRCGFGFRLHHQKSVFVHPRSSKSIRLSVRRLLHNSHPAHVTNHSRAICNAGAASLIDQICVLTMVGLEVVDEPLGGLFPITES